MMREEITSKINIWKEIKDIIKDAIEDILKFKEKENHLKKESSYPRKKYW